MNWVDNIFSTRELATIIWALIAFVILILWKKMRPHIKEIISAALSPKLLLYDITFIAYIIGAILILKHSNFWDISLLKDTIFWFILSALALFYNVNTANDKSFFIKALMSTITIAVLIEFISNLYTFPLWIEIIMVPVIFFLAMMYTYAELSSKNNPDHKKVYSCLSFILNLIGWTYIIFSICKTVKHLEVFTWSLAKEFLLPIILTLLLLPYLYVILLIIKYEWLFVGNKNLVFKNKSKWEKRKIQLAIIYYGNFSLKRIKRINKNLNHLNYQDKPYKEFIKKISSRPLHLKKPIGDNMSIPIFNDIERCINLFSKLGIGEFSEWEHNIYDETYMSGSSYYKFNPDNFLKPNDIIIHLLGKELFVEKMECGISIYDKDEYQEVISTVNSLFKSIFEILSINVSDQFSQSLIDGNNFSVNNTIYFIELMFEKLNRMDNITININSKNVQSVT